MKKIDEAARLIREYEGPPIKLMEVCGTHTHRIFEYGIREMLSDRITLISGPGCPVCVTPSEYIDRAAELSLVPGNVVCTFGDMIRVPGRRESLAAVQARGGQVRIMYSPADVAVWAEAEPEKTFIVAAVGFETTLPAYALLMEKLMSSEISNVKLLTSLKVLMPALENICESGDDIAGFLGPGHVSAIIGAGAYRPLCEKYHIPLAVAGFSYEHIVAAVCDLLLQHRQNTCKVHNLYTEAVSEEGNRQAIDLINRYFVKKDSAWRGLGSIKGSGYFLAPDYASFDAGSVFENAEDDGANGCLCGSVITGRKVPTDCPLFGTACTPVNPFGPCMVSQEGTCGIWYNHAQGKGAAE